MIDAVTNQLTQVIVIDVFRTRVAEKFVSLGIGRWMSYGMRGTRDEKESDRACESLRCALRARREDARFGFVDFHEWRRKRFAYVGKKTLPTGVSSTRLEQNIRNFGPQRRLQLFCNNSAYGVAVTCK